MPISKAKEFEPVYRQLKGILQKHKKGLKAETDKQGNYVLWTGVSQKFKKPIWFGCVRTGKSYVSYHLMSVYVYPDLLREVPAELKKSMQGKSCFNFKKADKQLFAALERVTRKSWERYKKEGLLEA
jgi:hypothetical protein